MVNEQWERHCLGFGKRSGKNGHGQQHSRIPEEHREREHRDPSSKGSLPVKVPLCLECPPDSGFMECSRLGTGLAGGVTVPEEVGSIPNPWILAMGGISWTYRPRGVRGECHPCVYLSMDLSRLPLTLSIPCSRYPTFLKRASSSQLGAPQEGRFPGNAVSMCGMAAPDGFNLGSRPLSLLLASHSREQWSSLCCNKHLQQERNPSLFPIPPPAPPSQENAVFPLSLQAIIWD